MKMIMPETQDFSLAKWDRLTRNAFPMNPVKFAMGMTFLEVKEYNVWLSTRLADGTLVKEDGLIKMKNKVPLESLESFKDRLTKSHLKLSDLKGEKLENNEDP